MRLVALLLAFALAGTPALAQDQPSISKSIDRAAAAVAAEQSGSGARHHGAMFWSGLALGVGGATASVLAVTTMRVDDRSSGNAPRNTYQNCVAQQSDPIYASNQCTALKGRNDKLLWSGVAIGALGAALMIGDIQARAEIDTGAITIQKRIRF